MVGGKHAVAGDNEGQGVGVAGIADGAVGAGGVDLLCDAFVGGGVGVGGGADGLECLDEEV